MSDAKSKPHAEPSKPDAKSDPKHETQKGASPAAGKDSKDSKKKDAKKDAKAAPAAAPAAKPAPPPLRGWRDRWQVPALLIGAGLLVGGLMIMPRPKGGPDYAGALAAIDAKIHAGEYDAAIKDLNGPVTALLADPVTPDSQRAAFHAMRGEALYLGQRVLNIDVAENNRKILEQFETAKHFDESSISGRRVGFLADTLVSLGRADDAERLLEQVPENATDLRRRLTKRLIDHRMSVPKPDYADIADRLARFRAQPGVSKPDHLWAIARQNEIRLSTQSPQRLIDELLVEIQRQPDQSKPEVGELFLLLGRAYFDLGEIDQAWANLSRASEVLPEADALHGVAEMLLARISQVRGELEDARDRFGAVVARYQSPDAMLPARLGLAEVEFDLGLEKEAFEGYERVIAGLGSRGPRTAVTQADIERSLDQRYRKSTEEGKHEIALRFAQISASFYAEKDLPAPAVLRLAETHLALAEQGARALQLEAESDPHAGAPDPVTLRAIRGHFAEASRFYKAHSRLVGVSDPVVSSDSLWKAADAADRAGDQPGAIQLFSSYAGNRTNDVRWLQARFRLARAFQSRGEHATAISIFESILSNSPDSAEALSSVGPLAQAHLAVGEEANLKKAETLLLDLLSGRKVEPNSIPFRDALIELGGLYRRTGRYPEAIDRLSEGLSRFPDAPGIHRIRFDLADSFRLSAGVIERELQNAMPAAERAELAGTREDRLRKALSMYDLVRTGVEAIADAARAPVDRVVLRNSIFYRADCAYDLGDYDAAITFYDSAAQRYADDPASLVSMIQIVNCYAALGKWGEARTAHERARARLAELPDEAWKRADVPMDRRHWERWLEATSRLDQLGASADGSPDRTAQPG